MARLVGPLPQFQNHRSHFGNEDVTPVDVCVEATMAVEGHTFDGPVRSTWAPASPSGCEWQATNSAGAIPLATRVCCCDVLTAPLPLPTSLVWQAMQPYPGPNNSLAHDLDGRARQGEPEQIP